MTLLNINHSDKAVGRVPDDLNKENFNKFVTVFTEEMQILEEALLILAEQKDINTVTGVWLEYLGKLIGEERKGRVDSEYRAALKLKISSNSADGTPDTISLLVKDYTSSDNVRLSEGSIAWGVLYFDGSINIDNTLHKLVEDIKPVGTKWILQSDEAQNALDMAWETAVNTSVQVNVAAECGDLIECGDNPSECGDSALRTATTTTISLYPPTINPKNPLSWEAVHYTIGVECGDVQVECGEQGAECGNVRIIADVEDTRPLRWEVTENSLVQV